MRGFNAGQGVEAEPNVIPMIDILLVLLLIFMIASSQVRKAIDARLPDTVRSTAPPQHQIVLELLPGSGIALNGQPVPDATLDAALRQIFETRPGKLLFVRAAGDRSYQEVVDAMDRARGAGVQVIGITPRP